MRGFASGRTGITYDKKNDVYDLLGVKPGDDSKKIKVSYYKLAQKYHPDKNPGFEEKFKSISSAYDILKNEDTRKQYDEAKDRYNNPQKHQSTY